VLKSKVTAKGVPFRAVIFTTILQAGAQPLQFKFNIPFAGNENA
jgi:hypothetical protein